MRDRERERAREREIQMECEKDKRYTVEIRTSKNREFIDNNGDSLNLMCVCVLCESMGVGCT